MQRQKYIAMWVGIFLLDILVVGLGPVSRIHRLNDHRVVVTGHIAGLPDGGVRVRAPYTYVYNGVTYAGYGRAFAPNLPARYLTSGQAVTVTLNSDNPSQSVLGDSRIAQRAANRMLVLTAILIPTIVVSICFLWSRFKPRPYDPTLPSQNLAPQL